MGSFTAFVSNWYEGTYAQCFSYHIYVLLSSISLRACKGPMELSFIQREQ